MFYLDYTTIIIEILHRKSYGCNFATVRDETMEFNEKLQDLRKRHKLTQEQLSQKLHISRTAVSKWESGRGFPNIEALKNISRIFNIPIDHLLSGEELLDAALSDNKTRRYKLLSLIFGIYDFMLISFIFLPLYGEKRGDYIYSVNLLQMTDNSWVKSSYYILFIAICLFGFIEIILHFSNNEKIQKGLRITSLIVHSTAVLHFTATREPYVNSFLFLLLLSKIVFIIRKT